MNNNEKKKTKKFDIPLCFQSRNISEEYIGKLVVLFILIERVFRE